MTTQVNSTVLGTLGNLTVTGNVNIAGNISASKYTGGSVNVTGNISVFGNAIFGQSGQVGGAFHTVVGNITQISSGGAVYFNTTGNISASVANFGNGNVGGFAIGYRDLPQITASNVTLALSDASEHFYANTGAPTTITVPSNANVAFPIGTTIVIVNRGAGNITIQNQSAGAPFLYLAGNATTITSRTLTQYGMATLLKTETNLWFVNGTGLV